MPVQSTDELIISRMGIVGKATAQEIADLNQTSVGGTIENTFETFSKNLKDYNKTITYNSNEDVSTVTYDLGAGLQVTKTYNYLLNGDVDTIILSGDLPNNINTTKTLSYSNDNVVAITYS